MSFSCSRCRVQYKVNDCKIVNHTYDHNVSTTGQVSPFTTQAECDLFSFQQLNRLQDDHGVDFEVVSATFEQDPFIP